LLIFLGVIDENNGDVSSEHTVPYYIGQLMQFEYRTFSVRKCQKKYCLSNSAFLSASTHCAWNL